MSEYRDYGTLGDSEAIGVPISNIHYGQVYQATHKGIDRTDYMYRSFISFTYGGRHIEDFNLIATFNNKRLVRQGYAPFSDNTSNYDNLDGQYYWGTHYKNNSLDFTLSTDGIDQKALDDFLYWFAAGNTRELILAEHPNRAILARVSEPPQLNLLPFEHPIQMTMGTHAIAGHTTLYKGDITLKFVMDQPHWYAKVNVLGIKRAKNGREYYEDYYIDANGNEVNIYNSQDALKILYEDGIPLGSLIYNNMLLGNKAYAQVEGDVQSLIWSTDTVIWSNGVPSGQGARIDGTVISGDTDINSKPGTYYGKIAGAVINADGTGISSLAANENGYFFYSGTAPAPTIITFTIEPTFNNNGYFKSIGNSYTSPEEPYSSIFIESKTKQELRLTTPNIITSYNKALNILSTNALTDKMQAELIEYVRHPIVRALVNSIITYGESTNTTTIKNKMKELFNNNPIEFSFNSETGEATGKFKLKTADGVKEFTEDVGDMLRSNNIVIRDRNYPDSNGQFISWKNVAADGHDRLYSHRIYHTFKTSISNLQIEYKNMYL